MAEKVDAILVLSFGEPSDAEDLGPFVSSLVESGQADDSMREALTRRYESLLGEGEHVVAGPAFAGALRAELEDMGPEVPVYYAARVGTPSIESAIADMTRDGVKYALALVTSAFGGVDGCRAYLDEITRARAAIGEGATEVSKLRIFYNHPGFLGPNTQYARDVMRAIPTERRAGAHLVFAAPATPVAHGCPCQFAEQLRDVTRLVGLSLGRTKYDIAYLDPIGKGGGPWLSPSLSEVLHAAAEREVKDVILVPIAFLLEGIEVRWDLDVEAKAMAEALGIELTRAEVVGAHSALMRMARDLILERVTGTPLRHAIGKRGAQPDDCYEAGCSNEGREEPSAES